jgi:phosphoribosylamine--glycine ligase
VGDRIELGVAATGGDTLVFHAGTKREGSALTTAGGRVVTVTGLGRTLEDAQRAAYDRVATIRWRGEHHRSDIGHRALARAES